MGEAARSQFRGTERFELVALLGRGATGVVYEAFDREHGLRTALKVLALRSPEAISLFKNEFRALHGIRHPNLVALSELLFEEGHWLLTMELVAGVEVVAYARGANARAPTPGTVSFVSATPIDETLPSAKPVRPSLVPDFPAGGSFSEARIRASFEQLAEGLNALHAANKIHRDLKPSNVLVDANGRVVVLDFGLVTDLGAAGSVEHEFLLGTPRYMAPEQAALRGVGRASDWYSVGVMLYEALTGRTPFAGPRDLLAERRLLPVPPAQLSAQIPGDLSELCMKLLAQAPEQRPEGHAVLARLAPRQTRRAPERFASAADSIFVGRESELQTLHEALETVRGREPVAVLVEAESGIGKTALVQRFLDQVQASAEPALCFIGRCFERESLPYKALDGVMDAVSGHLSALPEAEAARLLPGGIVAVIAQAFPAFRRIDRAPVSNRELLEAVEPHVQRERIFSALRDLFVRLAQDRTLIVVIDDLQWSDIDSLALLSALLRPPAAPQMLLVAISRPGGPLAQVPVLGSVLHLPLGPLSPAESATLVSTLLCRTAEPAALSQQVQAVTGEAQGHPMFLREMVRQIENSPARRAAPVRLEEALWRRVAALDRATRELIELTSIAGRPIAQGTVASALAMASAHRGEPGGARDEARTKDRLAELRHACLIRSTGSHPNDTVEPYHDRVREAVIAHLEPEQRKRHHLSLARALEQAESRDAEALASHWQEAGGHAEAYGYARLAAEQAAAALAFERAARLYRLSLELGPSDRAVRRELTRKLGDALANAGRGLDAAEAYEAAAQDDESLAGLDLRRLAAEQLLRSGYIERGVRKVSDVLAQMGVRSPKSRMLALLSIGWLRARIRWRGFGYRHRSASEITPLELARIDGTWMAATCLLLFDQLRSAELQCQNTLLSLRGGTPLQVLRAHTAEAMFLGMEGSPNRARIDRLLSAATELADQLGHPHARAWVALCRGATAFFLGEWLEGKTQCQNAEVAFQERAGALFELASARVFRVWSSMMRGEFAEVSRLVPGYVTDAENRGDLYSGTYHMTGFGNLVWLSADDVSEARRMLGLVEQRWPGELFHVPRFLNLQAAVNVELYDGRGKVAHERVLRDWASLRWGVGFRAQMTRFAVRYARAASALVCYDETAERGLLREAAACARAIARENVSWSNCFSDVILSGVAIRRGAEEQALAYLVRAEEGATLSGINMQRAVIRHRRGELIGGDEGRALVRETLAFMATQNIKRPERMLAMMTPTL